MAMRLPRSASSPPKTLARWSRSAIDCVGWSRSHCEEDGAQVGVALEPGEQEVLLVERRLELAELGDERVGRLHLVSWKRAARETSTGLAVLQLGGP
jgi:hypothetical protein